MNEKVILNKETYDDILKDYLKKRQSNNSKIIHEELDGGDKKDE